MINSRRHENVISTAIEQSFVLVSTYNLKVVSKLFTKGKLNKKGVSPTKNVSR